MSHVLILYARNVPLIHNNVKYVLLTTTAQHSSCHLKDNIGNAIMVAKIVFKMAIKEAPNVWNAKIVSTSLKANIASNVSTQDVSHASIIHRLRSRNVQIVQRITFCHPMINFVRNAQILVRSVLMMELEKRHVINVSKAFT